MNITYRGRVYLIHSELEIRPLVEWLTSRAA